MVISALEPLLETTITKWALALLVIFIVGSILSGLIDIAVTIAQYGLLVLLVLAVFEIVVPGAVSGVLSVAA